MKYHFIEIDLYEGDVLDTKVVEGSTLDEILKQVVDEEGVEYLKSVTKSTSYGWKFRGEETLYQIIKIEQ